MIFAATHVLSILLSAECRLDNRHEEEDELVDTVIMRLLGLYVKLRLELSTYDTFALCKITWR